MKAMGKPPAMGGNPVPLDLLCGFQIPVGESHTVDPKGLKSFTDKYVNGNALVFVVPNWMH